MVKVRYQFVSNSSTTSFVAVGVMVIDDERELLEQFWGKDMYDYIDGGGEGDGTMHQAGDEWIFGVSTDLWTYNAECKPYTANEFISVVVDALEEAQELCAKVGIAKEQVWIFHVGCSNG